MRREEAVMAESSPITDSLPKKKFHKEIRIAVDRVLDSMVVGTKFSGSELPGMCAAIEPKCRNTEGETIRRYMRYWRGRGRGKVVCIDRANSIYQKMDMED